MTAGSGVHTGGVIVSGAASRPFVVLGVAVTSVGALLLAGSMFLLVQHPGVEETPLALGILILGLGGFLGLAWGARDDSPKRSPPWCET